MGYESYITMINLFKKLEKEELLKQEGKLLDIGCGDGGISKPFFNYGYDVTLVDKDDGVLSKARDNFKQIKEVGFKTINVALEDYIFSEHFDGIIMSNVLPFQKDKERINKTIQTAFSNLNEKGFLFFTLFGVKDEWNGKFPGMNFHNKEEALGVLETEPYYFSEDYGKGLTMKGEMKTWHIFHLLYIKN